MRRCVFASGSAVGEGNGHPCLGPCTRLSSNKRSYQETRGAPPTKLLTPLGAHILDQDPRDEAGDDSGGAMGVEDGEMRGHTGEIDTLRWSTLRNSGVLPSGVFDGTQVTPENYQHDFVLYSYSSDSHCVVACRRRADSMASIWMSLSCDSSWYLWKNYGHLSGHGNVGRQYSQFGDDSNS